MKFKCLLTAAMLGLGGCAPKASQELQNSIRANALAGSLAEWEGSNSNPVVVFKRFRKVPTAQPCEALEALSLQDLTLFEGEIKNPENQNLLKKCQANLRSKIESYWRAQREVFKHAAGLDFLFETQVEIRDLSHGYRARTGDVGDKELVLTFDDGPDPELTPKILDILKAVDAKVMFFAIGRRVQAAPAVVYRAGAEGHRLGSHSMAAHPLIVNVPDHLCLANSALCAKSNGGTALTYEEATEEIRAGHEAVFKAAGFVDPFFRFPYGESDPALAKYLADHQMGQFYWSIDSGDWKNRTNQEMLDDVLSQVRTQKKGIVLFHDIHRRTLEVLPAFLKAIHDEGYKLVVIQGNDPQARLHSPLLTNEPLVL